MICPPCPLCIPIYLWIFIIFVAILASYNIKWARRFIDKRRDKIERSKIMSKIVGYIYSPKGSKNDERKKQ